MKNIQLFDFEGHEVRIVGTSENQEKVLPAYRVSMYLYRIRKSISMSENRQNLRLTQTY